MVLMDPRTVKIRSTSGTVHEYVRVVAASREAGKVKQRVVADLGRKDLLVEILPKLRRLLTGEVGIEAADLAEPQIGEASNWGPILAVRALFDQLGLWEILDQNLGHAKGVPFADRAFVLVANRLIAPASEPGLAGWLETDFVCDRKGRRFIPHWHQRRRVRVHPRQLDSWYRTRDQLHTAKERIEVALYRRLRDHFRLKPDLVLYDITSTYCEGGGPHDFARHGSSRDGKSQNVQVIVGLVMVAGWPVAHHVWAGHRIDHSTVQEVINDLRKRFELGRLVFVGDRGMVTDKNIESITKDKQGFLVGIKRRRNAKLDASRPSTTRSGSSVPAALIPGNGRPIRRARAPRKSPPEIPSCAGSSSIPTNAGATSRRSANRRWSGHASNWRSSRSVSPPAT